MEKSPYDLLSTLLSKDFVTKLHGSLVRIKEKRDKLIISS